MTIAPGFNDHVGPTPRQRMRMIVAKIAAEHGLTVDHIMSRSRFGQVVEARHAAICAIVRLCPQRSYPEVGRFFGLDHTSIMHAVHVSGEFVPRVSSNQARTIIDWRRVTAEAAVQQGQAAE